MTSIDKEQIKNIAHSVRIAMTDEEVDKYVKLLNPLLKQVDRLNELNTEDVEPTTHGIALGNVLREDEPIQSLSQKEALKNAPEKEDGHFKVPSVME